MSIKSLLRFYVIFKSNKIDFKEIRTVIAVARAHAQFHTVTRSYTSFFFIKQGSRKTSQKMRL